MTDLEDRPDLPPGWRWAPFGEITDHRLGKMLDKRKNKGTLRPYLRNVNVRWHGFDLEDVKEMRVEDDEMDKYTVRRGDLVICEGGEPGRAAVWTWDEPMVYQKAVHRARPRDGVEAEYLLYVLEDAEASGRLAGHFTGSTINHLTGRALAEVEVPLAPLEEQRRIVDALEAVFADLEAGVAALTEARAGLERYRRSVLKAAVEGALTAGWRAAHPDAEPAPRLLESVEAERRARWEADQLAKYEAKGKTPPKNWRSRYKPPAALEDADLEAVPDGWAWASAESVAAPEPRSLAIGPFGSNLKVSDYRGEGVPLVFVRNIRSGTYIGLDDHFVTPDKADDLEAHRVDPGDVLITKMGEPPGDADLYPLHRPPAIITADCIKLRPSRHVRADYLVHATNSAVLAEQIRNITSGVAQQKVSLKRFRSVGYPVPPLEEQAAIVEAVDQKLSVLEAVALEVEAGLARAERLRRSVLRRAFQGGLVPQRALEDERAGGAGLEVGAQTALDFGA